MAGPCLDPPRRDARTGDIRDCHHAGMAGAGFCDTDIAALGSGLALKVRQGEDCDQSGGIRGNHSWKNMEDAMSGARLKHYGWGRENEVMTAEEQAFVLGRYHAKFARDAFETKAVPRLEDLALRAPRVALPSSLAAFCTSERYDRVAHTYGKSYPDYVPAVLAAYDSAPDVVAYPL